MSRELKFRAWHPYEKKYMEKPNILFENDSTVIDKFHVVFFSYGEYDGCLDEAVIEQFTGLSDKNGKPIYEGDLIRGTYQSHIGPKTFSSTVVWDEEEACFTFEAPSYYWETDGLYSGWANLEVIGNIHETR